MVCMYFIIPHLVAVHLVAVLECKCFSQRNVDGIAHNGYGESVTDYGGEQSSVWNPRGIESGNRKRR